MRPSTPTPQLTIPTGTGVADASWRLTLTDGRRAVAVVAQRELLRQLKQRSSLAAQALQMVFFLLVYAVGVASQVPTSGGLSFAAFVFPGIVAINVVTTGVSAGMTYAWDREYGFAREMFVAPVPRIAIPLGKALGVTVQATVQASVLLLAAPVVGVRLGAVSFLLGLVTAALVAAVFCLLGLLLACLVHRADVLQSMVQLLMYPLLFLSGSVFDPASAPTWLQTAMHLNPMSYAVDLLRQALLVSQPGVVPTVLSARQDLVLLLVLALGLFTGLRARVGR
jgi:ABC-2 type transport system permease protein